MVPDFTYPISAGALVEQSFPFPLLQRQISLTHTHKPTREPKQREAVQNRSAAPERCAGAHSRTQRCHPSAASRVGPASEGGSALGKDTAGACTWDINGFAVCPWEELLEQQAARGKAARDGR